MNISRLKRSLLVLALVSASGAAFAQAPADDIEGLFNKDEEQTSQSVDVKMKPDDSNSNQGTTKNVDVKNVSDLGKLSEFDDIAVIQKRYLPKTGRFEFFIAPTMVLNDAFFLNYGGNARLGYSFSERYSIEAIGFILSTSKRAVTTGLENRGVTTTSLVTPKSYLGLDFKWTPVYGKMASPNSHITPFDLYFAVGAGMTGTLNGGSEATLHLGTGQIFARTKNTAYRWDFSWNMFTAQQSISTNRSFFNTLFISVGMSFLFPDAGYR